MERSFQLQQAFTLTKQPALETACQTADINKRTSCEEFSPGALEDDVRITDAEHYGKGHNWATYSEVLLRKASLGTRKHSLSDMLAMYAVGMVMGKVATTSPFAGVYDHVFTFKEPASDEDGVDCISTSIIEKVGGAGQYLYSGVVTPQVTITGGAGADHVKLTYNQIARKRAVDVTSLPALSSLSYMKFLRSTIMFGAQTDSPETMVSDEVISFEVMLNQNPDFWALPGVAEADELFYSRATVGKQTASGRISTFIDPARIALFENDTVCKARITMVGSTITGSYKRTVTIDIPYLKLAAATPAAERNMIKTDLTFDENTVLKSGSTEPVTVTVRSAIDDTEILVESA